MKPKIPIFIITRDRLTVLKESIWSYHKCFKDPFEIVIHDNRTTYPETKKYLKQLEKKGTKVFWNTRDLGNKISELNSVKYSIKEYLKKSDSPYYIVTDPDIAFYDAPGDTLEFYSYLLDKNPWANAVGPWLRLDDIPDSYPLKKRVMQRKFKYWRKNPFKVRFKRNEYSYTILRIDSIFAMYRRSYVFRLKKLNTIGCYSPYAAKHLDWYLDPKNLAPDQKAYLSKCRTDKRIAEISHWSGVFLNNYLKTGKI